MSGLSAPKPRTDRTPVVQSVYRAITSAGVATLSESNFAQIDDCDDADELRGVAAGGGVVAFYRRSRPLMFDTYSGTNGRLTPFVGVDLNAISFNLGSSAVARKLEVGMLLHLRIKISSIEK